MTAKRSSDMNIDLNTWEVVQELKKSRIFNMLTEKEQLEAVAHILRLCGEPYMPEDTDFAKEMSEIYLKSDDISPPQSIMQSLATV
jgi:hypothetical protein